MRLDRHQMSMALTLPFAAAADELQRDPVEMGACMCEIN
jgi:hypothetical protein